MPLPAGSRLGPYEVATLSARVAWYLRPFDRPDGRIVTLGKTSRNPLGGGPCYEISFRRCHSDFRGDGIALFGGPDNISLAQIAAGCTHARWTARPPGSLD